MSFALAISNNPWIGAIQPSCSGILLLMKASSNLADVSGGTAAIF